MSEPDFLGVYHHLSLPEGATYGTLYSAIEREGLREMKEREDLILRYTDAISRLGRRNWPVSHPIATLFAHVGLEGGHGEIKMYDPCDGGFIRFSNNFWAENAKMPPWRNTLYVFVSKEIKAAYTLTRG